MRSTRLIRLACCILFLLSLRPVSAQQEDTEEPEDSTFDDYLGVIGFYDTAGPDSNKSLYPKWSTSVIHPNQQDISLITDTTMVVLTDGNNMIFHPPCFGNVTSTFGYRQLRRKRRGRYHYGTDVKLYTGDPVYAAWDGIVRIAQYSRTYGYVVVVRHYNGLETVYAHFSKLLAVPGLPIRAGQPIGLGGNTGRSYGSHLHFEIRFKGLAIDPQRIIDFDNDRLWNDTLYIHQGYFDHLKNRKVYSKGTSVRKKGTTTAKGGANYHTVRRGETLGQIAARNRVTVAQICRLNGIKSTTLIRPGQRLRLR